jgi:7-carboxy-7-deazaguanine synthase
MIGRPTVFVRLGGCDYRCSWCDSLHAVLPEHRHKWTQMPPEDVLMDVCRLTGDQPILITLSGGNPALQNGCEELIRLGHQQGFTFTMETQGSIIHDWMAQLDHLCISPKPPSSGMTTNWSTLGELLGMRSLSGLSYRYRPKDTILKVVVFTGNAFKKDFEYAAQVHELAVHYDVPLYLQVGNDDVTVREGVSLGNFAALDRQRGELLSSLKVLAEKVLEQGWYDTRVLPQLHCLIWGNRLGV